MNFDKQINVTPDEDLQVKIDELEALKTFP